jgi:hypothetical protein
MNDFPQAVNFIASAIDLMTRNATGTTARQISEMHSSNNRARGGNGRGRGRGRGDPRGGRGRGRGRNGRGRGRNNGRTQESEPENVTRSYSAEEWQNLSAAQRSRIYRERERLNTARTIAAVLQEQNDSSNAPPDVMSTITASVAPGNTTNAYQQRSTGQINLENISQSLNRRRIGAYHTIRRMNKTSMRIISNVKRNATNTMQCRAELDSHADTCGVNDIAFILEYTGQEAEVSGFSPSLQTLENISIVKAAVAYDDPQTGETFIIIINQALYFGEHLPHILLNPNQLRAHGTIVDDAPKHLTNGTSSHSIHFPEDKLRIPLKLHGIISYFSIRTPTKQEIDTCHTIVMTSEHIEWNPYSTHFEEQENHYDTTNTKDRNIASINVESDDYSDTLMRKLSSATTKKKQLFIDGDK